MLRTESLRRRLIAAVTLTLVACGGETSTDSTTAPGGAGASGSPGGGGASGMGGTQAAGGASGGGAGSGQAGAGAGPTAACHEGAACATTETCSYPTGEPIMTPCGGCSAPSMYCQCNAGTFACSSSFAGGMGDPTVCYVSDGSCLPGGAAAVQKLNTERWGAGCPVLFDVTGGPTEQAASDGTKECCYPVSLGLCAGRPLTVDAAPRLSPLAARSDWA